MFFFYNSNIKDELNCVFILNEITLCCRSRCHTFNSRQILLMLMYFFNQFMYNLITFLATKKQKKQWQPAVS